MVCKIDKVWKTKKRRFFMKNVEDQLKIFFNEKWRKLLPYIKNVSVEKEDKIYKNFNKY